MPIDMSSITTGNAAKKKAKKSEGGGILGNSFVKKGVGVLATTADIIGRPSQAVLGAARAGYDNGFSPGAYAKGAWKGLSGQQHLRGDEAILGKHVGGVGGGFLRFGLETATDPLTYLTMGTGKAAGVGTKAAGETAARVVAREGGEEIAQVAARETTEALVKQQGLKKALAAKGLEEQAVKDVLVEQALEKGINPRRTLGQVLKGQAKGTIENGAERYADNILTETAKRGRGGIMLAAPGSKKALTLVSGETLGKIGAREVGGVSINLAKNALKETSLARGAARAFKPGAALEQRFGQALGSTIHKLSRGREEEVDLLVSDAVRQTNKARQQIQDFGESHEKIINEALDQGDVGLERLRNTSPELMPVAEPLFQLKNQMDTLLDESARNGNVRLGGSTLEATQRTRVLSKAGQKTLRDRGRAEQIANALDVTTDDVLASQHQLAQKVAPGMDTAAANRHLSQRLQDANLLKKGESFLEESATKTSVAHAKSVADQVATAKQVKSLAELTDDVTGAPLLLKDGAVNVPKTYVEIDMGPLGKFHAPEALRRELRHVTAVIVDDPALAKFGKLNDDWTRLWKQSATTLPVGGAFTARNARSNVFLNYLAGVKNPAHYGDAMRIQKAISRVERKFGKEVAAGDFMPTLERELKNDRLFSAYKEARETGAITSSYSAQDLGTGIQEVQKLRKGIARVKNVPGKVPRLGSKMNQIVEDNARLAHFIAKRDELGSASLAADSVKKYLFDYGDLTPFERQLKKRYIPFYTFMRKNTPLMLEELAKNPGKFTTREHFADMFGVRPDEDATDAKGPNYLRGERKLDAALSTLLGGEGSEFISKNDTPLAAASETVEPLVAGVGAIPVIGNIVPDSAKAQDRGDLFRKLVKPWSGPQIEAAKYVVEEATGKSLFTGGSTAYQNPYDRFAKVTTPAYGRGSGIIKPIFKEDKSKRAALLNAITGLRAQRITKSQGRQLDAIEAELTTRKEG